MDSGRISRECILSLLERGHRKIGMIAGPWEISTSMERLSGYQSALEKLRFPTRRSWWFTEVIPSRAAMRP